MSNDFDAHKNKFSIFFLFEETKNYLANHKIFWVYLKSLRFANVEQIVTSCTKNCHK